MPVTLSDPVSGTGLTLTIDPDDSPFELSDPDTGRRLLEFDAPPPELETQWASSADTEGERRAGWRYTNRQITATVLLTQTSDALLEALEGLLGQTIGKLQREGGELQLGYPTGSTITFDVEEATFRRVFDKTDVFRTRAQYEVTFTCLPLGRGVAVTLGSHSETTLPVLVFTETDIAGDVPAAPTELEITNGSASVQRSVWWGMQSRHYSADASAALFYQAEAFSADNGATIEAGTAGASGSGSNVIRAEVPTASFLQYLEMSDASGTAPLTHVGGFRVLCRVLCASNGNVDVRLRYVGSRLGPAGVTNPVASYLDSWDGSWRILDLGLIDVADGGWLGYIEARTDSGGVDPNEAIEFDWFALIPYDEGYGEAVGPSNPNSQPLEASGTMTITDESVVSSTGTLVGVAPPQSYEGDFLRVPASGRAGRSVRFIIKASRGVVDATADAGIDDISAQLTYTPRYLIVPGG